MPTQHLLIKGIVQGVFFRATAKKIADAHSVTGWIKNTPDGNVEALVSGTEKQLQAFTGWCRQGPDKAKVEQVVITPAPETSFSEFEIVRRK